MNKAIIIGRLTKDPEVRYTQSGNTVATFTLAVDRRVSKDKPKEADFIPCVVWGKTAEVVERWCKKGKQLAIEGRIQARSYDAKDGSKRYVTEVIVSELELLGSKNDSGSQQSGGRPQLSDEEIPF
ncbi:single-stranded DNA-binding protein [uncultured Mitsuokella sp.]|uniref:single-stranded DNA-binding protein n=1 Tax=uncultured Mitsuokella sp. TaxID=453120 RepID=UPI0025913032|nr:single-stranded DNA-binding protein [uncultured Mitsuokella sp.]